VILLLVLIELITAILAVSSTYLQMSVDAQCEEEKNCVPMQNMLLNDYRAIIEAKNKDIFNLEEKIKLYEKSIN
jgi:hypothetical protein